jgi:hypothetical protein
MVINEQDKKSYRIFSAPYLAAILTWASIHCRSAVHFMNVGRFHVDEKNEEFCTEN